MADDGMSGPELWKSNGTEAGTVLVKDIRVGFNESYETFPMSLTNVEGTLYFTADDGTSGRELWKSDGTETGTVRVKDIRLGSSSSSPSFLTDVGGTLYFTANDGTSGAELWKSDGTEMGTVRVKDIGPGSNTSNPRYLANVGGTLYFNAFEDTIFDELWKSDGTEADTVRVKGMFNATYGLSKLTNVAGTLYFTADDGVHGQELWVLDPSNPIPGDLNGDLAINFADLTPFVLALTDPDTYTAMYPLLDREFLCDVSGDGECNLGDIGPFVALLTGDMAAGTVSSPLTVDDDGRHSNARALVFKAGLLQPPLGGSMLHRATPRAAHSTGAPTATRDHDLLLVQLATRPVSETAVPKFSRPLDEPRAETNDSVRDEAFAVLEARDKPR
jgi:ELWxxDGT repeat protein